MIARPTASPFGYGAHVDGRGGAVIDVVFPVTDAMTFAREEIVGPVLAVLALAGDDLVATPSNTMELFLYFGVSTADLARSHRVESRLRAGTCSMNACSLTRVETPVGGSRQSGVGRENSMAAVEHYALVRSVYVNLGDVEVPN